jgi:hypothetical protein
VTIQRQDRPAEPISLFTLWFSALAGPLAWILHNVGSYGLATVICFPGQVLFLHLVTAVTALISLAAAVVGWRSRARLQELEWPDKSRISLQRAHFMATFGLISGLLFLVIILVEGIPNFYIEPCLSVL